MALIKTRLINGRKLGLSKLPEQNRRRFWFGLFWFDVSGAEGFLSRPAGWRGLSWAALAPLLSYTVA